MSTRTIILPLLLLMSSPLGFALEESPQSFTFQGRLFNSAGTLPLTEPVSLKFQILNPSGSCLLYEENQDLDLTETEGSFAVSVGSAVGAPKRAVGIDPALSMATIFKNDTSSQTQANISSCPGGYTPSAGDARLLRVTVTPLSTGIPETLSPDQTINSVPQATVAETLQGLGPSDFVRKDAQITSSALDLLFGRNGVVDASTLHTHDDRYVQIGGSSGFNTTVQSSVGSSNNFASTMMSVKTSGDSEVGLAVRSNTTTQTADLFQVQDSLGSTLMSVSSEGGVSATDLSSSGILNLNDAGSPSLKFFGPSQAGFVSNDVPSVYLTQAGGSYPFDVEGNLIIQGKTQAGFSQDIVLATGDTTPSSSLVIKNNGKVGIGTDAPTDKLHVLSTDSKGLTLEDSAQVRLHLKNPTKSWFIANGFSMWGYDDLFFIDSRTTDPRFSPFTIRDFSGKRTVGMGTIPSASSRLKVDYDAGVTEGINVYGSLASGSAWVYGTKLGSSLSGAFSGSATSLAIDSNSTAYASNNVGIRVKLYQSANNLKYGQVAVSGSASFSGTGGSNLYGATGGSFIASTSSSTNVTPLTGLSATVQNTGTGTVLDAYGGKFTIAGAGPITNAYGVFIADIVGTNQFGLYQIGVDDVNYLAGNLGIGTSTPGYKLQVGEAADGSEARANAWNILSDERLKKNFRPVPKALDKLLQVNGYFYEWNRGADRKRKLGVKAQEVERVFPEVISKGEDGFLSVSYGHLVAAVIEALKEITEMISKNHQEIASLKEEKERQFDEMKAQNQQIRQENKSMRKFLCSKYPEEEFCKE